MRRFAVVFAFALVASSSPHAVAYETDVTVSAFDTAGYDLFDPSRIELRRGGTVTFTFDGPSSHTATDGSGLDLYDSGVVGAGGPDEVFSYVAAGTYEVVCTLHAEMGATVYVPVDVTPSSVERGDLVTVRWAARRAPGGYAYDVQFRKPRGVWTLWRDGVTARAAALEVRRAGTWRFRARLTSTTAASGWSRIDVAVVATPG